MAQSKERRNEIAYAVLKTLLKEQGFEIDASFRRRVGNIAKQSALPFGEVLEFSVDIAQELLSELADPKKPPTEEEAAGQVGHGNSFGFRGGH